jgi:GNAT superfamily N-acetyltransferase
MQILNINDEPQHIPTLGNWHHKQWSYLNPDGSVEKRIEKMNAYLCTNLIPSTFIAKDTLLMGSAAIVAQDMDSRPDLTPWLASVFVAPEYRSNGIGSNLVRHVMQKAKEAGIKMLYLFTPDRETFYQKLGWHVLSKEDYRGYSVTIMYIKLNG